MFVFCGYTGEVVGKLSSTLFGLFGRYVENHSITKELESEKHAELDLITAKKVRLATDL
jgi:hypothetical protein